MKNNSLIITLLLALLGVLAVPAAGAEKEAKKEKVGPRILQKYDADKDGKLSPEEKAAWEADKEKKREEKKKKKAGEKVAPGSVE